jgi:hypothetical protein
MPIPFWDPGAIDADGKAPGITSVLPSSTAPFPDELSPWDVITLNGVRAPGSARLEGGKHIPYDRKAAIGQLVGAASLFVFDPVSFSLILTLWTPQQWDELQQMTPQILPPPGPNPQPRAVKVEYPSLAWIGVDTIYFEGAELPRMTVKGAMEFTFTCYEWRPPLPVTPVDIGSPLPQGNRPGATQPTNTVTPPSQSTTSLGP